MTETITYDKNINTRIKATCSKCGKGINHTILKSVNVDGQEEVDIHNIFFWNAAHQIIRCEGCETISFRSLTSDSEDSDFCTDENGQTIQHDIEREELYPFRNPRNVKSPHYMMLLPIGLYEVYQETIRAMNANLPILTAIGIGAVIETVAKGAKAQGRNLEKKIDNLVVLGVLTSQGAVILHKLRDLRNEAAHEVKRHKQEDLNTALDVIENMFDAVYVLPARVRKISK